MNRKEADELVDKALKVISSCKTIDQIAYAERYCGFVVEQLGEFLNLTGFYEAMHRAIGYNLCKITHGLSC